MEEEKKLVNSNGPKLINLSADKQSDRKIVHDLKISGDQTVIVGRRNKEDPTKDPPIALGEVGIEKEHAVFKLVPPVSMGIYGL